MNTQVLAVSRLRLSAPGLAGIVAPLGLGLVALGLLFHAEIAAAVRVWVEFDGVQSLFSGDPDRRLSDLGPA